MRPERLRDGVCRVGVVPLRCAVVHMRCYIDCYTVPTARFPSLHDWVRRRPFGAATLSAAVRAPVRTDANCAE